MRTRTRKRLAIIDRERADWKRWCQEAEARAETAEARQVPAGWKVEWAYTPHLDDTSGNKVTLSSAPRLVPVTEGGLDD